MTPAVNLDKFRPRLSAVGLDWCIDCMNDCDDCDTGGDETMDTLHIVTAHNRLLCKGEDSIQIGDWWPEDPSTYRPACADCLRIAKERNMEVIS